MFFPVLSKADLEKINPSRAKTSSKPKPGIKRPREEDMKFNIGEEKVEDFTPKQAKTIKDINIKFAPNGYVSCKRVTGISKSNNSFEFDALIISSLKSKKNDNGFPESFDIKFHLRIYHLIQPQSFHFAS